MLGIFRSLLILAVAVLLGACASTREATVPDTTRTFTTVVVDAGHGGRDAGAFERSGPPEKNATLDVATRLAKKLRESEFKTVMTRSTDVFIPLDTRVDIENTTKNAIFVSIHFNDTRRRGIRGFETYYHAASARPLAQRIQNKLMTIKGAVNRGVRSANFRVIRKAKVPAVLVECGFLSNRTEGGEARSSEYREILADKIAEAIVEARYGSGVYKVREDAAASDAGSTIQSPPSTGPGLAPSKLQRP